MGIWPVPIEKKEKSTTDMATHALLNNIQLSLDKKKACRWDILWPPKGIWLCKL